jgi:hypothetical protein
MATSPYGVLKGQPSYISDAKGPTSANAYGNGGSKGNVLGRTAGSNNTGQVAFTGDSTYNDQANALSKAASDYAAQVAAQKQQATQQYDWNLADSNRVSGVDQYNMVNDFAGRGVLNSGLYAKSEDDRQANVTRQQQQMALALQNQLSGYNNDLANFQSENAIALNKAKADAIARQAAKIGIG